MANDLHVIFGTGPVGCSAAASLLEKGYRVRMINRSGRPPALLSWAQGREPDSRVEIRAADATSEAEVLAAGEGATCLYHCANVLYQDWHRVLPGLHANLRAAAVRNGAVLAVAENLYMYARGVPVINEKTREDPPSRKGSLQKRLHQGLVDAAAKDGLRWVSVRASDFYGPGAELQSVFGTTRFLDPLFAGKRPGMIGDPDMPHTFAFVEDYGRALVAAALRPEAHGKAWIVPSDRTLTTREVARLFFAAVGRETDISRIPRALIAMAGLFNPLLRELTEVLYQKEEPYVVDGGSFQTKFDFAPTTLEEGVRRTLEWYRASRSLPQAAAA